MDLYHPNPVHSGPSYRTVLLFEFYEKPTIGWPSLALWLEIPVFAIFDYSNLWSVFKHTILVYFSFIIIYGKILIWLNRVPILEITWGALKFSAFYFVHSVSSIFPFYVLFRSLSWSKHVALSLLVSISVDDTPSSFRADTRVATEVQTFFHINTIICSPNHKTVQEWKRRDLKTIGHFMQWPVLSRYLMLFSSLRDNI